MPTDLGSWKLAVNTVQADVSDCACWCLTMLMTCFAGSNPLFRLSAHDKPTCALSFCPAAPGLLATASTDQQVKLWRITGGAPSLLAAKEPKLGALFSAGFCRDVPYLLAMAGAKGSVGVWDVRSCSQVAAGWPELMKDALAEGQAQ